LKEELAKPFREIQAQARTIAKISAESKVLVNEEEYLQSFKPQLMEVVYAWTNGASFATIWYVLPTHTTLTQHEELPQLKHSVCLLVK
jgi:superfamily II RNA helicase